MNHRHRSTSRSDSASSDANDSLATASRSSGQADSTGCNSGVYGGSATSSTCSGTTRLLAVCPPAPSQTSTSLFFPCGSAHRAHSDSAALTHSAVNSGSSSQNISAVPGRAKPYTYSHSRLISCGAAGRCPLGAHTRRTIGTKPMRHSSSAQTSTGRPGSAARRWATRPARFFFPGRLLLGGGGLGVAGAWSLGGEAELAQPLPAGGLVHRCAGQLGDAAGQLGAAPQAAVGGAAEQFGLQLLLLGRRQPGGAARAAGAACDGRRAAGVVAVDQFADGIGGEPDQFGGLRSGARLPGVAEQPQGLPACPLSAVGAAAEARGEFLGSQMAFQLESWPRHEALLSGSDPRKLDIKNSQGDSVLHTAAGPRPPPVRRPGHE